MYGLRIVEQLPERSAAAAAADDEKGRIDEIQTILPHCSTERGTDSTTQNTGKEGRYVTDRAIYR